MLKFLSLIWEYENFLKRPSSPPSFRSLCPVRVVAVASFEILEHGGGRGAGLFW